MPSFTGTLSVSCIHDGRAVQAMKWAGRRSLPALALSCILVGAALANDGFDDGSFEDPGQTPQQEATQTPADGSGDGFTDGSFDDPEAQTEQAVTTVDDDGGGFDGTGGSFDDVAADETGQPEDRRAEGGEAPAGGGDDFVDGGDFDRPDQVGDDTAQEEARQEDSELTELPPDNTPDTKGGGMVDEVPVDNGILAFETRDFGVPPTNRLRPSQFHAPTPTSIPGGQVVTTARLAGAMNAGQQILLIDVLGGEYTLPNALSATGMAQPGNYRDRTQQQTNQWLGQISGGNTQATIVIYCSDPHCWLSYNASLRAIAAGYTNVFWYRGGMQAWNMAGLPLTSGGF